MMSLPTLQGASSSTWTRPPLDGSLTLPELYAFHAERSPEHPLFVYADDVDQMHKIHYPEAFCAMRKAAKITREHYDRVEGEYARHGVSDASLDQPPVIGIIANTGECRC